MNETTECASMKAIPSDGNDTSGSRSEGFMRQLRNSATDLDDLRTLITCRICIRPLYEPYTISCGHTFCYTCLRQWFEKDRTQRTCPECRCKVVQQPAPAYLVRDITQIFISRAEFLPEGETLEDFKKWQQEEADIVEKDKKNDSRGGGLFGGRFRHLPHHNLSAIRDVEDGVDRCPLCSWELTAEGHCTSCGFETDNTYPFSASVSDFTDDEHPAYFMGSELEALDVRMSALEESENTDHNMLENLDGHARRPRFPSRLSRTYFGSLTDDGFGETDDDSSEEGYSGSLRDFVVDEDGMEDRHPVHLSPQSSHYDSEEASGIFEALGSYSSDEQSDVRVENGISQGSETDAATTGSPANYPNIISIEDDDSDEGPVLRTRVRAYRRSLASPESNRGNEADDISTLQSHTARRRNTRGPHHMAPRADASTFHPRSPQAAVTSGTRVRGTPMEIESNSDSSYHIRYPRNRPGRAAPNRVVSDEDEVATAGSGNNSAPSRQSSSPTRTIGRRSPVRSGFRDSIGLATVESPIVLSSSPALPRRSHDSNPARSTGYPRRSVGSPRVRRSHYNSWSPRRPIRPPSHTNQAIVSLDTTRDSDLYTREGLLREAQERLMRRASRLLKKQQRQRRARERVIAASDDVEAPLAAAEPGGVRLRDRRSDVEELEESTRQSYTPEQF